MEIEVGQNERLLKDITVKFLTKSLKSRPVEKKIGHGFEISNLSRTIRVFKWIVFLGGKQNKKMTTENSLKTVDSLKQIYFNYITRL